MLIGIVSDTHDHVTPYLVGLQRLRAMGAEYFIHCGDVGSEQILDLLAGFPTTFVWGNNDWDTLDLEAYAKQLQIHCAGRFASLTLDGKEIAVIHGDDETLKRKILAEQKHDYLLQGHTHVFKDVKIGKTRIINPGALHRANPKSVALLNTRTDALHRLILS